MKMFFIEKDIDVTNTIIKIIEQETVLDIKSSMENRMVGKTDD